MFIIGLLFFFAAAALYGLVTTGLIFASVILSRRHASSPGHSRHELVQCALWASALALLIAPVMFGVLYVPIDGVSAEGNQTLAVLKPRIIHDLRIAVAITIVGSGLLAVTGPSIFYLVKRRRARG